MKLFSFWSQIKTKIHLYKIGLKKNKVKMVLTLITAGLFLAAAAILVLKIIASTACPSGNICNEAQALYPDSSGVVKSVTSNQVVTLINIPDNPPTVSITNPASGTTVSSTVNATANASDDKGVSKVDFLVDGALKNSDTAAPYAWSWDTTAYSHASHTVTARAYDNRSPTPQTADANITVTVSNTVVVNAVISNVSVAPSSYSATITWTTNIPTNTQFNYGTSTSYGFSAPDQGNGTTNHKVVITNLNRKTYYYYKIIATAPSNGSQASYSNSFKTRAAIK